MATTPALVFGDRVRADMSPCGHAEPTARFLDRVGGDYWAQVRALIEEWVANIPSEARPDIVGRLRSREAGKFHGAFWELYLHETFVQSGFSVSIHPKLAHSNRQPDFRVRRGSEVFYVEAKVLVGDEQIGQSARQHRLYDVLDRIDCPNFFLEIEVMSVGAADLGAARLRRALEKWTSSLDPDAVEITDDYEESGPRLPWSEAGWELLFRPFPVKQEFRGSPDHRPLGIFGPTEMIEDGSNIFRAALADKGSAYGDLDYPLVLAINCLALDYDNFETMNALYGTSQITFSRRPGSKAIPTRAKDGYWYRGSWAHDHVAEVLVGSAVVPWNVTRQIPTFWPHPMPATATSVLPIWRAASPSSGRIEHTEPEAPLHAVLGLASDWPIGEPFPRDGRP